MTSQRTACPRVTVLMPIYNGSLYLDKAIESILNQSFQDYEFLIINDASTDNSREIVLSYEDARMRLIDNETNLGLVSSLNKGIDLARGEFLARMDQDDISMPERFAKQVAFMDANPEVSVLGTWAKKINDDGHTLGDINTPVGQQMDCMYWRPSPFIHPTVMIRFSHLEGIRYEEDLQSAEDYGLWLSLRSNDRKLVNLAEYLLKYRVHENNMSVISRESQLVSGYLAFQKYIAADFVSYIEFLALIGCSYGVNPVKRAFKNFKLCKVLGHPHALYFRDDLRYCAGWLDTKFTHPFKHKQK